MSVLLLSGGLDSTVLLALEVSGGRRPLCVGFDYGQRHRRELAAARRIAAHYGCHFVQERLPEGVLGGGCIAGDLPVPHAHYADPVQAVTVVPNRNMVLLALAGALAVRHAKTMVLYAAHAGDAAVYPDCRPAFVEAAHTTMQLGCGVGIHAPFLAMTKRDIAAIGKTLGVPFEITWSCYEGGSEPCEKCGACRERCEALA